MRKRNWSNYNKQLVKRGSLTVFIDEKVLNEKRSFLNKRGRPRLFSSCLIQLLLVLKIQYRLTYRALEGFTKSILPLLKKSICVPTYSLVCKRACKLECTLPKLSSRKPQVILLDASGIKIYGEGEWKCKVHGKGKRRQWIKLHLAVDPKSQEIIVLAVTKSKIADSCIAPRLIKQSPNSVKEVIADGAYDTKNCYDSIRQKGARALIPPRKNARLGSMASRNEALCMIKGLGGDNIAKKLWGRLTGYSKRSLVETAFSRLKTLYGERFYSRKTTTQQLEAYLKCSIMNKMMNLKAA